MSALCSTGSRSSIARHTSATSSSFDAEQIALHFGGAKLSRFGRQGAPVVGSLHRLNDQARRSASVSIQMPAARRHRPRHGTRRHHAGALWTIARTCCVGNSILPSCSISRRTLTAPREASASICALACCLAIARWQSAQQQFSRDRRAALVTRRRLFSMASSKRLALGNFTGFGFVKSCNVTPLGLPSRSHASQVASAPDALRHAAALASLRSISRFRSSVSFVDLLFLRQRRGDRCRAG